MTGDEAMIELVSGYPVHTGYAYDLANHFWVDPSASGAHAVGMDALGLDTSGTLAQLAFDAVGETVARGAPFGTLEAEKFVGSLIAPMSGRIVAVNEAAMTDPGLVQSDPYGAGWMIRLEPSNRDAELALLIVGRAAIRDGFTEKVRYYRLEGVLAE